MTLSSWVATSHVEKRYDVFYSSRVYCVIWTLWVVTPFIKYYPVRFSGHRPRRSRNCTFFICYMTSSYHAIEMTCDFIACDSLSSLLHFVATIYIKSGGHSSHENGDITFFIFHVTWCVHVINELCDFVENIFSSEASLENIFSSSSLVAIDIV